MHCLDCNQSSGSISSSNFCDCWEFLLLLLLLLLLSFIAEQSNITLTLVLALVQIICSSHSLSHSDAYELLWLALAYETRQLEGRTHDVMKNHHPKGHKSWSVGSESEYYHIM